MMTATLPPNHISRVIKLSTYGFFQTTNWFPPMAKKLGLTVVGSAQESPFLSLHTDYSYFVTGTAEQFTALTQAMAAKYREDLEASRRYDQARVVKLKAKVAARPYKAIRSILSRLGGPDMQAGIAATTTVACLFTAPLTLGAFMFSIYAGIAALLIDVSLIWLIRIALINQDDLIDLAKISDLQA